MKKNLLGMGALLVALGASSALATVSVAYDNAAARVGSHLVTSQAGNGSWAGEENFTGAIIAGLSDAYQAYGTPAYKSTAEAGAGFIIGNNSHYLGDEAYGLTRVSDLQANPGSNTYFNAVKTYYNTTIGSTPAATNSYLNTFVNHYSNPAPPDTEDESQPVIFLAYHTMAAYHVDAAQKGLWRQKLVDTLGNVDDADYFPVESLGAAIWALAHTGNGLDGTTISGSSTQLAGLTLAQLPDKLKQQMILAGDNVGSSYYDFGHTDGGYTEDTAMALMGLQAAADAGYGTGLASYLASGRDAIAGAVEPDGTTQLDVAQTYNTDMYVYGGRMLEAVPEPTSCLILAGFSGLMCMRRHRASSALA
jgi:hypothetical protein